MSPGPDFDTTLRDPMRDGKRANAAAAPQGSDCQRLYRLNERFAGIFPRQCPAARALDAKSANGASLSTISAASPDADATRARQLSIALYLTFGRRMRAPLRHSDLSHCPNRDVRHRMAPHVCSPYARITRFADPSLWRAAFTAASAGVRRGRRERRFVCHTEASSDSIA